MKINLRFSVFSVFT